MKRKKGTKKSFWGLKKTTEEINQEVGVLPQSLRSLQHVIPMKPEKRPRGDVSKGTELIGNDTMSTG